MVLNNEDVYSNELWYNTTQIGIRYLYNIIFILEYNKDGDNILEKMVHHL